MILRKLQAKAPDRWGSGAFAPPADEKNSSQPGVLRFYHRGVTLRTRLAALTACVVIISILLITVAANMLVSRMLYQQIDKNLQTQAEYYMDSGMDIPESMNYEDNRYVPEFEKITNSMQVLVIPAVEAQGDIDIAAFSQVLSPAQLDVVEGREPFSFSNVNVNRVYAVRALDGRVVVVSQDISLTCEALDTLHLVLILVGVTSASGAIVAGVAVARAGIQPIERLRRAAERVTATGELRHIPVETNDELGRLTHSYNDMMTALQNSVEKQRDLVADAGHELKTPLTSLRTNIELMMMASRRDSMQLSESDWADIERDVVAQINEMSTLIGDLVDLAREDSTLPSKEEVVDLKDVIDECVTRVQRRRPDVTFEIHSIPWFLKGDSFSLSRAFRNLLDNAAKWSPHGGRVRVWMEPVEDPHDAAQKVASTVEVRVADSGPGIPPEERDKVFDRFYRSIQARSMPGSGLGLAIVKQVIMRHDGVIIADESDDGGALMRVVLHGSPGNAL